MTEHELTGLNKALTNLAAGQMSEDDRSLIAQTLQDLLPIIEEIPHEGDVSEVLAKLRQNQVELQRLAQVLERRIAEQDIIRQVSLNLTSSLDLKQVLRSVLAASMQLVGSIDDGHIFLYDSGRLTFGAALFSSGQERQPYTAIRPHGLTYTVARLAKVIAVPDMTAHPLFKDTEWEGSILGIPLKIGLRVVGVMTAYRPLPQDFSDDDLRLLQLMADHAAIAIENARLHNLVDQQARLDPLTGLHNRRSLDDLLENEVHRYQQTLAVKGNLGAQRSFSLLLLDLDNFQAINDRYGRQAGDYVLKEVSYAISQALRKTDFLARYGGDEMAVVLSDTDREMSLNIAARIQEYVSMSRFNLPDISQKAMTVSIGVALYPEHGSSVSELIEAAGRALDHVKIHDMGGVAFADAPLNPAGD